MVAFGAAALAYSESIVAPKTVTRDAGSAQSGCTCFRLPPEYDDNPNALRKFVQSVVEYRSEVFDHGNRLSRAAYARIECRRHIVDRREIGPERRCSICRCIR